MAIHQRKFKTADEFAEAVEGYFTWADNNPVRLQYSRKAKGDADADRPTSRENTDAYVVRPYLLQELAYRIGIGAWCSFKRDNREREGFEAIIEYAENRVASQQLTGAMVGLYRENIVARLNGVFDNVGVTPPPSTIEVRIEE